MPLPPIVYRRDLTRALLPEERDGTVENIATRLAAVEAAIPAAARGITGVTYAAGQFTINYSDSTADVVDVQAATWNFTNQAGHGAFLPLHAYAVNDVFIADFLLVRVIFPHTSAASFDLGANDGLGHDFYKEELSFPSLNFTDLEGSLSFADITGAPSLSQLRAADVVELATSGAVLLDPTAADTFTLTPTGDMTINCTTTPPANANIVIDVLTDGGTSYAITFGTGFVSQGVLNTGTSGDKHFSVSFRGNGSKLVEVARTPAM